jgi:hypothetical protein
MTRQWNNIGKSLVIFKQYGEQRTGTNYVKRLLETNFTNVIVLSSILGWKHGLYEHKNDYSAICKSHRDWLDHQFKGGSVYSVDDYRVSFTYDFLLTAIPNLKYLVSIKRLLPWVYSFRKFRRRAVPWSLKEVRTWIERYFINYQNWACLLEETNGILISQEKLFANFDKILGTLESRFGLARKTGNFQDESFVVQASTDLGLNLATNDKFDKSFYLEERFLLEIPSVVVDLVREYSDREEKLMARLARFCL